MIDYRKKLTIHRELYPIDDINNSVESDRGRIFSAPAFRRLQKRTQVFPLELNAAVRSRLTHSLEVQQTARYISKTILSKLENKSLDGLDNAFVSTSEMSSLLHDIGNPPFGHFAELAINEWMKTVGVKCLDKLCPNSSELKQILIRDLYNFDGNAQAIRIVSKLQRLNLSYTQVASILKYTRGAYDDKPQRNDEFSYLKKKPGFYYSEKDFVQKVCDSLDIKSGCRFPLTYIMEAADDISYLTADLKDAVDKGILKLEDVYNLIKQESEEVNKKYGTQESFLMDIIEKNYEKVKANEDEPYQFNLFLTLTRAELVNQLVNYVADIYIQNHQEIFDGEFNMALLDFDKKNRYSIAIEVLQNISKKHIYSNKDKQTQELKGYAILTGLFECYKPLLGLENESFEKLLSEEPIECFLSQRLIKRLSAKHIVAYQNSIKELDKEQEGYELLEWYYRARLLIDYISGMTDDFALAEYKTLKAL